MQIINMEKDFYIDCISQKQWKKNINSLANNINFCSKRKYKRNLFVMKQSHISSLVSAGLFPSLHPSSGMLLVIHLSSCTEIQGMKFHLLKITPSIKGFKKRCKGESKQTTTVTMVNINVFYNPVRRNTTIWAKLRAILFWMTFTWELKLSLEYPTQSPNCFGPSYWDRACQAQLTGAVAQTNSYRNSSLRFSACSPIHQWTSLFDSYKKNVLHVFRCCCPSTNALTNS